MAEIAARRADWQSILAAPEGMKAEVLAGELITSPRPLASHGLLQVTLSATLEPPFYRGRGGPGGWWILIEPDVALGEHDIVSPDLVGWRRDRLPSLPETRPIDVVPDWICEVLSPSTARHDRVRKSDLYLRSGVPYYWMADVQDRVLEAYEAQEGRWVRLGAWTDGDLVRIAPFDAVEVAIGELFPPVA